MSLFPFRDDRAAAQRAVHDTFAAPATYAAPGFSQVQVPINVRLETQSVSDTDLSGSGYGSLLTPIDKVIFLRDDVLNAGITPVKGGKVTFTGILKLDGTPLVKQLVLQDLIDGPLELVWQVD